MSLNVLTQSKVGGTTWRLWATCSCISSVGVYHGKAWRFMPTLHTQKTASCVCLSVCVSVSWSDSHFYYVCFVGWHIKRTVSEDRRHETKHSHRGPVWELPWYVGNAVRYDPLLMNVYQCCFSVLQRRWPPTYDTWGGWTSLKNQTMNICGLCSLNCLSVKATPLTTRTTGLAGR